MNTSNAAIDPENPGGTNHPLAPRQVSHRVLRAALGLFIVWQIVFLVIGNATSFLVRVLEPPTSSPAMIAKAMAEMTDAWSKLTGQDQNWRLFAPLVPTRTLLVDVSFDGANAPAAPSEA